MSEKVIFRCRICGKLMSRYPFCVYPGDESCCAECNKEAESNETYTNKINTDGRPINS